MDFDQIKFTSRLHRYTYNGKKLRSVTNYLSQFTEPFDREHWLTRKSKDLGISEEELAAQWDAKGQASREKGDQVHQHIENVCLGIINPLDKYEAMSEFIPEEAAFNELWTDLSQQVEVLQNEWIIGDERWGLAGTVDALFMDKETHEILIFDWKTGEKFDFTNPYGKKLLPPFDMLPECKFHQYSLQTSLYRLMIERNMDMKIAVCKIVHFTPLGSYCIYTAADHREALTQLLDNHG